MFSAPVCNEPGPFEKNLVSYQIFFLLLRFDDLVIVVLSEEFGLEDDKVYGGVILLTLRIDSIKDYMVNTLVHKILFPFGQPDHEVMTSGAFEYAY